nr:activator of Hsp90 ATPase homolog 1-like protein [uncultured bacterium]
MIMIWTFQPQGERTLVTVQAMNVPEGIRPEDHSAGLNSSLEKLAEFVETQ